MIFTSVRVLTIHQRSIPRTAAQIVATLPRTRDELCDAILFVGYISTVREARSSPFFEIELFS